MADKNVGRDARITRGVYQNQDVVYVELTGGYRAIVDPDVWPRIRRDYGERWMCHGDGKGRLYAHKKQRDGAGGTRIVALGRAVMRAMPGERVECLNGDSLDCRRANLDLLETVAAKKRQREFAEKRAAYRNAKYDTHRAKRDRETGGPERRRLAREARRDRHLPADQLAARFKASARNGGGQ